MDNLVYNDGKNIWIKMNNAYYRRDIGIGFLPVDESALPADIPWSAMPDIMKDVYSKQLPGREG